MADYRLLSPKTQPLNVTTEHGVLVVYHSDRYHKSLLYYPPDAKSGRPAYWVYNPLTISGGQIPPEAHTIYTYYFGAWVHDTGENAKAHTWYIARAYPRATKETDISSVVIPDVRPEEIKSKLFHEIALEIGTITGKLAMLEETKRLMRKALEENGAVISDSDTFRSYTEKVFLKERAYQITCIQEGVFPTSAKAGAIVVSATPVNSTVIIQTADGGRAPVGQVNDRAYFVMPAQDITIGFL